MTDQPRDTTDSLLDALAAGGLTATVAFAGPADRCPWCRPLLADAA